jgi:hypothetical protein
MRRTHAPTFNKWLKKKKKKKTLHMLTHGAMRGCGLTSWVVCIKDRFRDIRERNVTIRSEIWATNIHSVGFRVWHYGGWYYGVEGVLVCVYTGRSQLPWHNNTVTLPPESHNVGWPQQRRPMQQVCGDICTSIIIQQCRRRRSLQHSACLLSVCLCCVCGLSLSFSLCLSLCLSGVCL